MEVMTLSNLKQFGLHRRFDANFRFCKRRQRRLTERLTAGVSRALTTVLLHGRELLIRLAEFPHAAARRQVRRVPPIRLAAPREPPLKELLLVVLLLHGQNVIVPCILYVDVNFR